MYGDPEGVAVEILFPLSCFHGSVAEIVYRIRADYAQVYSTQLCLVLMNYLSMIRLSGHVKAT